jgi:hypothetical protein
MLSNHMPTSTKGINFPAFRRYMKRQKGPAKRGRTKVVSRGSGVSERMTVPRTWTILPVK